jgi:signal transduction histidine kinase/CheY-like chemotaxis protein
MFGFQSKEEAATWNTVRLYASPEKRERVLALLRERKVLENFELELHKRNGTPLWVIANLIGIFNDAGELTSIRSYLFDNTERRRLEEGLRQSQKMESIGTLAGGITHDFNNILGIILGYVSLIRRDRNQPERLDASIDAIGKAVERAAGLVNQILTFAHRTPVAIQAVQVNDVLKDMARLVRETFPKNITMHLELTEPLPAVAADTSQLHQVFLNLSVNARDAMPSGGTLTYRTMLVAGRVLRRKFNEAGRHPYVCVSLSDTGVGMDDTTRRRLFEPFYTTKRAGKGTGLGLAVVYGIIASHKGFVEVESAVNRGTTFHLYLPVAEEEQTQAEQVEQEIGAVLGGAETILLVEDEEMLMDVVSSSLRSKGYTVLTARDGDEALRVFEKHRGEIKLVITDFGLPLRTGFEVFQALRKKAPSLNVVLASGYIDPQQQTMMSAAGVRAFLQKPYQIAEVLKKIREILDERR